MRSVIVMAEGKVLAKGSALEIQANDDVIEAYLGSGPKKPIMSDINKIRSSNYELPCW